MQKVKIKILQFIFLFSSVFFLFSCDNSFYRATEDLEDGWRKKDTLSFSFKIEEPKKDYDIFFVLRNNNQYPFRNIILFTELDGRKDTVYYNVADKNGKWLGNGLGETKELTLQFKTNYHFASSGDETIKVRQAMRKDTLNGITDFGVIVNKKN